MNYEKKYKEAIESIKRIHNQADSYGKELIEKEFSELRESEDERIRRCIGMCLTDAIEQRFEDFNTTLKDCLAWLEKQGEQKHLPKWKKATEKKDLEKHIAILEENKVLLSNYLEEGDYYIELEDLKALPKEE